MSFKVRTWALGKTVSSLALIVSTWILAILTTPAVIPITLADNSAIGDGGGYSNITILDLYPELKEYLWQKALSQLESSTENYNYNNAGFQIPSQAQTQTAGTSQNNVGSAWDYNTLLASFNANSNTNKSPYYGNADNAGSDTGAFPRGDHIDADPMETYNQHAEILKYHHPFLSPEVYSGWKYRPQPSYPPPSHHNYPVWDDEPDFNEHVGYELSKDFSCVAGLLGLKTLKKLKIATIFKKIKLIAVFFIAFKLGLFLSPIAIPLLFPVILIATIAKILPLVLIIVLLLKLLKKQVKLKKPLGKLMDQTSSLFFDDIDTVTERVMKSQDCVDKISCDLSRKSSGKVRRVNDKKLDDDAEKPKS